MGTLFMCITIWLGIGFIVNLFVNLTEMYAGVMKGPEWLSEYHSEIHKEYGNFQTGTEKRKSSIWTQIFPLLWWPSIAILIGKAYYNKRTCGEQALAEFKESKRLLQCDLLRKQLILEGKWPVDFQWQIVSKDKNGTAYIRLTRFVLTHSDGRRQLYGTISHFIWEKPKGGIFICYRVVNQPVLHIPMTITLSKAVAMEQCNTDLDWISICAPGRETDRHQLGLEQQDRLGENPK